MTAAVRSGVLCGVVLCALAVVLANGDGQQKDAKEGKEEAEKPDARYTVVMHSTRPKKTPETSPFPMTNKDGRKFSCYLPVPKNDENADAQEPKHSTEQVAVVEEKSEVVEEAGLTLDERARGLTGKCFVWNQGYWSFELCHWRKIRQFHQGPDAQLDFSLGSFVRSSDPSVEETKKQAAHAVLSHFFDDGQRCDETDSPRNTEVRYQCVFDREDHVISIEEPKTCGYLVRFGTPSLCDAAAATKHDTAKQESVIARHLSNLDGACFYRVEGWWTYEFCYGQHIKQFHKEGEDVTAEFVLGRFDQAENDVQEKKQQDALKGAQAQAQQSFMQYYGAGDTCDITAQPRKVEVVFRCSSDALNVFQSIKEVATCEYQLVFLTPYICTHPAFQVTEEPVQHINCYPNQAPES